MQCAACGEQNPERARFCLNCGTPLVAATGGSREVRKTVTVLFADMVGFTSLGERIDGESLRRVMDRFYAEMSGAIEGEGGTVAKFIGDAVMAVWGTPAVREDDALRAVRAADDMRGRLASLNDDLTQRWGVRIGLRTGVNTGEVVVDPAKSADLLIGDTVNVAARLEQAAPDGMIYVGAETFRLVRDEAQLEPVAPLELKGKARPVSAWRLIDGRPAERRSAPRLQAPLVGREREVARLRSAFYAAAADRRTKLVTVIGSPGVGKSRLTAEFAEGLGGEAIVLEGRCEPSGEGLTFLPVAEVVRAATGIVEEDGVAEATAKLEALLPGEADADRIVERAMALLGLAPAVGVEETFWAVRRLLGALAKVRPVVLVLDDVHWAQPTLLDLHEHLVVWGRDAPLLVVAVARPELREVRPELTVPGPMVTDVIELAPLAEEDSRALVERLLGEADLPAELAERVLETTEGNPLFLGEMLRMLVDDGVLTREGDRWVAPDGAGLSVPPTINALLATRIERLTEAERCVVERASVIGQQFYRGAVAELSPDHVAVDVDAHLDRLRRKELVAPEGTVWIDEPVFRFHHVLIRDAAYRALLKEARADLHERFADWLEGKSGEVEELVAFHLERAYGYRDELGPLGERGVELGRRAASRLQSAGRRALAREDLPAAINLLERALAPLDVEGSMRVEVLVDLAEALVSAGDTARAEWVVDELAMRAGSDARARAWAGVFACQLATLTGLGQARETIEQASEAAAGLDAAGDDAGAAKAHQTAAGAHAQIGEIAAAEAALDRALVAARRAGDRRRVTAVLSGAPRAALWGPSPIVRASGRCLDVVRILRMTPGNRHVEAIALRCQAVLEAMRGRPDAARQILAGCRATLEELGLTLELHELAIHAGIVELLACDPAAAEQHLRAAKDGLHALGVDAGAGQAAALLARALVEQCRDEEAIEETAFAEARGGEDIKTGIVWRGARAEALGRQGQAALALSLAREAIAISEPTDALADKADAHMTLAAVLGVDDREGRAAAERARDLYAAKDHAVGVAEAEALLGGAVADEVSDAAPRPAAEAATARPVPPLVADQWRRWNELTATRDLEQIRTLYSDDFVMVDHRELGWEIPEGPDGALEVTDTWMATADDARAENDLLAGLDDGTIGVGAGGYSIYGRHGDAPFAVNLQLVTVIRGDQAVRSEQFEAGDCVSMWARFDELCAEHFDGLRLSRRAVGPIPSEAVRWRAAFGRLFSARDWDGLRALYAPDAVQSDGRAMSSEPVVGADAIVEGLRRGAELGRDIRVEHELLGARVVGDRVITAVLVRFIGEALDGGGAFEVVFGAVSTTRGGLLVHSQMVEPDVDAVLRELDEEAARASVRPEIPESITTGWKQMADGFTARDWSVADELLDRDIVHVDRRPMGWDRIEGRKADLEELLKAMLDVIPDARCDAEVLAGEAADGIGVSAGIFRWHGTHEHGAPGEIAVGMVIVAHAGSVVLIENHDAEDRAALLTRYDQLCAEHLAEPLGARLHQRFLDLANNREWDALRATWTEDYVSVDHRSMGWDAIPGGDESIEVLRSVVEMAPDVRFGSETLAAGERALASRFIAQGHGPDGGPFEVEFLQVTANRDGRAWHTEFFDLGDEERMLAAYHALSWSASWQETLAGRDWEGLEALHHDDVVQVERRPLGQAELQGAATVAREIRNGAEVMSELVARAGVDVVLGDRRRQVFAGELRLCGTVPGPGGAVEIVMYCVIVIRDGRAERLELFEPGDTETAHARAGELVGMTDAEGWTRALERFAETVARRDWEALAGFYVSDVHLTDHRSGMRHEGRGAAYALRVWQGLTEQSPDLSVAVEVLDARSPRLAAFRFVITGHYDHGGEFETATAQVVETDGDQRTIRVEIFDPVDAEAIIRRLDELAGGTTAQRLGDAFLVALNERAWDRAREIYADDVVHLDHRAVTAAEPLHGIDPVLAGLRAIVSVAPDARWDDRPVDLAGDRVALTRVTISGHDATGGGAMVEFWRLLQVGENDRIRLVELFDDEQAARRRMAELAEPEVVAKRGDRTTLVRDGDGFELRVMSRAGATVMRERFDDRAAADARLAVVGNWVEHHDQWRQTMVARDWEAMGRLVTEDFTALDNRPGLRNRVDGAEGLVSMWKAIVDVAPGVEIDITPFDVRSPFVAAARAVLSDASQGGEVVIEDVFLRAPDGRSARMETFTIEQRDELLGRLAEFENARAAS